MKKELYDNVAVKASIGPQFVNSNGAITGAAVDLQGYESAMLVATAGVMAGSAAANVHNFKLQESDSATTGFTDVAAGDLIGANPAHNGTTDNTVQKQSYIGKKRYLLVVDTVTGFTTAGGYVSASILLGHPQIASTGA